MTNSIRRARDNLYSTTIFGNDNVPSLYQTVIIKDNNSNGFLETIRK